MLLHKVELLYKVEVDITDWVSQILTGVVVEPGVMVERPDAA